jgi:hypothetical protein
MLPLLTKLTALAGRGRRGERRDSRRHPPGAVTPCRVRGPDDATPHDARVHNLSLHGAGLLAGRAYPPGTPLRVLLVNAAHTYALPVEMTVARCGRAAHGGHFLGGRFARPLRFDELLPFLV